MDTSTLTPARVRALADPIIRNWAETSEQALVARIREEPPGGRAAIGLTACLAAVTQHAVAVLAVPLRGLDPGVACRQCGALGVTETGCAHGDGDRFAVPDLIEETAIGTLHGDGEVRAVLEPPDGIAAYLRLPLRRSHST